MDFSNQPQIQLGPNDIQPISTGNITPAIQQLMDATRSGAIDFNTINDHFAQGAKTVGDVQATKEAVNSSRNRMELEPQIQELKKQNLELQAQIQPLLNSTALATAKTANIGAESNLAVAPAGASVQAAQAGAAQSAAQDLSDAEHMNGIRPGSLPAYQKLLATGITIPRDPVTRAVDYDAIDKINSLFDTGMLLAPGMGKEGIQLYNSAVAEAQKKGYDPTGMSLAQLNAKNAATVTPMTMEDYQKAQPSLTNARFAIDDLNRAAQYVNDKELEPVGSSITQGGAPEIVNARAKYIPNILDKNAVPKKAEQDFLQQSLAQSVQKTIQSMAGSGNRVMKAEIENKPNKDGSGGGLFYQAMPGLSADRSVWNTWIDQRKDLINRAYEEQRAILPPAVAHRHLPLDLGTSAAGPRLPDTIPGTSAPLLRNQLDPQSPDFAAGAASAVPVTKQEQILALKPGTRYVLPSGKQFIKKQDDTAP